MKLHIFNPEHDIALAANVRRFTAPHAARQLRSDVGFIPALWADDGDFVVVDDVEMAVRRSRHLKPYVADVLYLTTDDLREMVELNGSVQHLDVQPWGWDQGVAEVLRKAGLGDFCLSDKQLRDIRELSGRQWAAANLLPTLRQNLPFPTVGESQFVAREADLAFSESHPLVLKSPWSSSGRGIRYANDRQQWERNLTWARRVIRQQGGIMVEPFYDKVKDFAMEFETMDNGTAVYKGLSLFTTKNGAYTGNIIATERAKRDILSKFIPENALDILKNAIIELVQTELLNRHTYAGPFGIDMMIVRTENDETAVHPCVELNLRRTMGHAALSIACDETMPQRVMRLEYTDRYRLKIVNTNENVVDGYVL
ncbi:MAG: hypothetical protein IJ605_04595 [Prevotella sp.]|nr:hypothetical protein [Prevotella sp.]